MNAQLALSYIFTFLATILTLLALVLLPPEVPLWYSLAVPEQQLVPKIFLILFPVTMVIMIFVHTVIITKLRSMDATIIKIFSYGTTLATFLFLIALIHLVYIFL